MSLEAAIAANTAAIHQLIAVLQSPAPEASTADLYRQQKAITAEPPLTAPEAVAAASAVVQEAKAAASQASESNVIELNPPAPAATFEDVAATVRRLISGGKRDEIVHALEQFGCTKASELKPEQYDEFLSAVAVIEA